MSNKSLEQKYLELLQEYEKLRQEKVTQPPPSNPGNPNLSCERNLQGCARSHKSLLERKNLLQTEVISLYGAWVPPKISSFFKTVIPWIKKGFKKSEFAEYRFDICKKCDYLKDNQTCKICGCYMKGKVNIPQASCPLKKWTAENPKT